MKTTKKKMNKKIDIRTMCIILTACLTSFAMISCVSAPQPAPVFMPDKSAKSLAAGQDWLQGKTPTAKLDISINTKVSGGVAMALFVPIYQIPSVMSVGGNKMNIKLLKVEGVDLPSPPKKKQWAPVDVPAGKAITLTAQITDGGHTSEVEFTPPALSEGKTYILAIDTPFLTKKKGMRVKNRRHFMNRGAGAVFWTFFEIFIIYTIPDFFVEVFRPQFIKSDAPKAGTSILLYERLDDGKKKNKISLKLIYQYSISEMQGVLVP